MDDETLLDARRWREARLASANDLTELLAQIQGDSVTARTRRSEMLCRLGQQADAEFGLLGIPREERNALTWGTLALVLMERQDDLPERDRAELYARIVALPEEVDPEDPTYAEGQYMLDFARGQACGELGQFERARRLLIGAQRAQRILGLPEAPVRAALERVAGTPEQRLDLHRKRLREALASGSSCLVEAVADDLAACAADLHDYAVLAEAIEHMRPGERREAFRGAKAALLGHRGVVAPATDLLASGLPRAAAYLLAAERALKAEMGLRPEQAATLAREALLTSPRLTREHDLSRYGVLLIDARLLLVIGDAAGAVTRLRGVTEPRLKFHTEMAHTEVSLRLGEADDAREHLRLAHEALMALDEPRRRWACHLARRLFTNASYLLRVHYGVPEMEEVYHLQYLPHAPTSVQDRHRRWLDDHPEQVVAFRDLTSLLSSRSDN